MSSDFRELWSNCTYDQYENATGFPFAANATQEPPLTHERSYTVLIIYFFLFVVAAVGNLSVFISLFRIRHRKSRINLMIRHLTMADLVVTFIMLPMEIGWRLTVQWLAGNFACKAFVFLRAFGLYLSSNVLVCVSVDRYFAVLHPLKVNDARRRGKCMLAWAWSVSLICAIPQSIIFHVMPHPNNPDFHQCVTHGSFSSDIQQTAYNIFGLLVMYFFPLAVIIGAYSAIMCEISNKSKENKEDTYQTTTGRMRLRRSDISNIERARTRTLRMTIMIVVVFIICWTPYVVMTLWYTFDEETIGRIPNWLQDTLFMMAVSNSCMNPLVYGSYAINFRKQCCNFFCCSTSASQRNLADKQTGQCSGLLAHLIKYVLNFKVGSGVTRSTTILQTVANRSPISRPDNHSTGLLPKKMERPITFNHISFLSEPASRRCYRQSFHSDPYPCPDDVVGDNSQNSCGSDAHALASLL